MKIWRVRIHFISKEIFQYSLIAYVILFLIETLKQGLVSYFFNVNILLAAILFSGVAMVLTYNEKLEEVLKEKHHKFKTSEIEYIIVLAAGGAFLVWFKTQFMGILAIIISVITACIIVLLSLLVFLDKE